MIFPIWVCGVSGIKISSVYRGKVVSKCRLTDLWKDVFSTLRIDIFPQTLMTFLSDFDDTTVFLLRFKMSIFLQTRCNWATLWIATMVNRMLAIIARQWEQCHSSEEWKWKWERLAAGVDLSKEKWAFWQIGLGRVGKGWEINLQNTKLGTLECGLQSWEIYSERISLLNS